MDATLKINQKVLLYGQVKALDCSNGYWRYGIEVEYYDDVKKDYCEKLVWVTDIYEQGGKSNMEGRKSK